MSNSNVLRGTMMLTGANFLSKFLGIIYVIPFYLLVGDAGGALYTYAYNPYQIFLSVATLGIPLAMSKFIAKYNALEEYATKDAMLKTGLVLMLSMGTLAFLILFVSAQWLAQLIIPSNDLANSVEDVTFVIRMVSFALIILPAMSLFRGYFQGHESMGPTAVSIVVEQIIRIVFVLASAYLVIHVFKGTVTLAVGLATFAALIGAIASSAVLLTYFKKRKPMIDREAHLKGYGTVTRTKKDMMSELFTYAGPFVLVGIATPMYQMIDQFTFNRAMANIGLADISEKLLSVILLYGHKLVIIPVTIAIGLAMAVMPAITRSFTENNQAQYTSYIHQAFLIVMLLVLPASVGLAILSDQAYGSLYNVEEAISYAGPLLAYYAPVALFFALFTVSASMLQGINHQNYAVISLGVGLAVKLILNIPFIQMFEAKGAVFATGLAVLTAAALNILKIYRVTRFNVRPLYRKSLLIAILTAVMAVVVLLVKWFVGLPFGEEATKWKMITQLIFSVLIGAYAYLWMAYKTTLLERLLGDRVKRFSKWFI
ncbi:putative polysaccharide biosynthesis protein [Tenuibacillus multivorans]|uniref:Membrane protein involved in the export of O-antigen and teichoic acid n=1 Tax=Tenuibacillus multivorans TaxID=237069 RepID=A0A1H0ECH7_9BACI|nr:polysaccharide biosynthesis protein [Tenuibacillus multivorans]GEL77214.1 cell division protein [Tenuibacillus multivorans]SDN80072.1 Membrane protein involved in the export of O-antigen and teichoic acid [Tenuibacillus multivorans]